MAFVAAQNKITFNGSDTGPTFNLKVLRLVIKTILDAAEAEKTAHSRGSVYWFLDPNRTSGGTYPSEDGGADSAIYEFSSTGKGVGVFFKNTAGETALICYDGNSSYRVGTSEASTGIAFYPVTGSAASSNENSQTSNWNANGSCYGLSLGVSETDFGGLTTPWTSGFFSDGDLKPTSDGCSSDGQGCYSNGETADVIVGIDGKKLFINRRMSYHSNRDCVLFYGDILVNNDVTDTEIDAIFSIQQNTTTESSYKLYAQIRDKSGSTSYNPNGSNWLFVRKPQVNVNQLMINGSNSNNIPYTGLSFGWQSCASNAPNTVLNSNGIGYKGISDPSIVRVLTVDNMIDNKAVYNNNLFVLAQYYGSNLQFSLAVAWDANNPTINQ